MIEPLLLGVIGNPIGHSLSPTMQTTLLRKTGMSGCYLAYEIEESKLHDAVHAFKLLRFRGFNVTLPHKQAIMADLDEVREPAKQIGAVNTVLIDQDRLVGYNTDSPGFTRALKHNRVEVRNKTALVLGAGGAARAVIFALLAEGIKELFILNRSAERAESLLRHITAGTGFTNLSFDVFSQQNINDLMPQVELLINATPIGMVPDEQVSPYAFTGDSSRLTVVDLVYNPLETRFLGSAKEAGAQTVDGLDMLIFQGVAALEIWTGEEIAINHFYDELKTTLIDEIEGHEQH